MNSSCIVIRGLGAICSVGLSAAQMATACQAGIARFSELEIDPASADPFRVASIPDEALPELNWTLRKDLSQQSRRSRLVRLAHRPIEEATSDRLSQQPIPLFLGIGSVDRESESGNSLIGQISRQTGLEFDVATSQVFAEGRAAGLVALHAATQYLAHSGTCALVAAADSYLSLDTLRELDGHKRLLSDGVSDGFIPGEGCACLLLERKRPESTDPESVVCMGTAVESEPAGIGSDSANLGEGLTRVFDQVLSLSELSEGTTIDTIFAGLNGESFFAREFGLATLRHQDRFGEALKVEHPADCFGDIGAALGLAMVINAIRHIEKGIADSPVLIWCASDQEMRSAAVLGKFNACRETLSENIGV